MTEPIAVPLETALYHALRDMADEIEHERWADAALRAQREGKPVLALLFRNEALGKGI